MIKASAGGGGKGMRRCEKAEDFPAGYELAKAEARQAFGDDTVFLEKYIPASRHIEIQILADRHENVVTFPARNCSMQRKRQKVIEETPAFISKELSHKLAQDCRKIVHEIGFIGAGTAEFIVDENEEYYFLEINTRIQVEHGITEMISRTDLIEQQVRIAMDESICDNVQCQGYAIECRINAELNMALCLRLERSLLCICRAVMASVWIRHCIRDGKFLQAMIRCLPRSWHTAIQEQKPLCA